mgnify:CR=1 FL=1|tara:strand:+ start:1311 stop:1481 length:171 start_codon:yes stop_codon:yes gene_type:complete
MILKQKNTNVNKRKLGPNRQISIIKIVDSLENEDDENKETFTATPDNELPKNRLVE